MIKQNFDEVIRDRYKDRRKWRVIYPIELASAILDRARMDYITAKRTIIQNQKDERETDSNYVLMEYEVHTRCVDALRRMGVKDKEEEKEQQRVRVIHESHNMLYEVNTFIKSDWFVYLIWGADLKPSDIIREWDRQTDEYLKQHPHGNKSGNRLSKEVINQIYVLHSQGKKNYEIARELGISTDPVGRYLRKKGLKPNRKEKQ